MKQYTFVKKICIAFVLICTTPVHTIKISEKPIVVVIPSYNNQSYYKKNLQSVFQQQYNNYRIIYLNDASTDKTLQNVQKYIQQCKQQHRVTIINNTKNMGALYNHYTAAHLCQDHEIIINLDGDDFLKHKHVLSRVNKAYQDPNIWMTYGQFEHLYYSKAKGGFYTKPGSCKQIPKNIAHLNIYREYGWCSSHLRTFYAGLFKHIKLQDLLEDSSFYRSACDMAIMYPMLELSGGKFTFINEILYTYNCLNPNNVFRTNVKKQLRNSFVIRGKKKYTPITQKTPIKNHPSDEKITIILLSNNNQKMLHASLESIYAYVSDIDNITVLHHTNEILDQIKKDFAAVQYIATDTYNFKHRLEQAIQSTNSNYITLAKSGVIVKDFIHLNNCIQMLEQTYAYGFYLSLGKNIQENNNITDRQHIPPHTIITENIYAWQFKNGEYDWKHPHNLHMTIYKKTALLRKITRVKYNSIATLQNIWNHVKHNGNKVGLFYKTSKVLAIEPEQKNIDILPFFLLKNNSILLKTNLSFDEKLN